MQCSEFDDVSARFWENLILSFRRLDAPLIKELGQLGLLDTEDKIVRCFVIRRRHILPNPKGHYLHVLDNFHLVSNPRNHSLR